AGSALEFRRVEFIRLGAELAIDVNAALLGAFGDLLGREAFEDLADAAPRAGALVGDAGAGKDPYAVLVEQPIEQPLGLDRRIDELARLDRSDQRLALDPGIVGLDRVVGRAAVAT